MLDGFDDFTEGYVPYRVISQDGSVYIDTVACIQHFMGSYTDGYLLYKAIMPDGTTNIDTVDVGTRLEKSVLLYDSNSNPHIFVARSDDYDVEFLWFLD